MQTNENVNIQINSKADLKGFKVAESAASKLNKTIKNLATTLGVGYGAKAVINFGKASVSAFAADQAAAVRLTNAVDNLGYAFANNEITTFIKNLERTAGIQDDVLRPAFQALLTTTKDLNTSYKLLNDSIAISRGSGVDLATVAQDLANGYVGITRGLKKYNTGLTQSELKTKSFADVLGILNQQFAGANSAYLDTYAYKLDVLTVASNNAKETIGKGLIDAFARIAGGSDVQDAVKAIDNIAQAINGVVTAVSYAVSGLVKLYRALDYVTSLGGLLGANGKMAGGKSAASTTKAIIDTSKIQIKASKSLSKATSSNTAELKKQALLKKQNSLFDIQQIELIAALKGKLSDEDRKRAELQLALLQGDEATAAKLSTELANAIDKTGNLSKYLATLPDANNPFKNWSAYLDAVEAQAARIAAMSSQAMAGSSVSTNVGTGLNTPLPAGSLDYGGNVIGAPVPNFTPQITVQIDGKTIASSLMDQSLSGNQSYVDRRTGGFNW